MGTLTDVDRVVLGFGKLDPAGRRSARHFMAALDGEGEGVSAPSGRRDAVAGLPEPLQSAVTAALSTDAWARVEAARVLAASDAWRSAAPPHRSVAAWALQTFDRADGGAVVGPEGLRQAVGAVLGALDRRSGRWVDPPGAEPAPAVPFDLEPVDWASSAPPRDWLLEDLIPAGRVSALYGPGESGKSRLTLQLAAAVVADYDAPVLPMLPGTADRVEVPRVRVHGSVLLATWEDEVDELRRRMAAIRATRGCDVPSVEAMQERLRVLDMRRVGGPLWAPRADGSRHTSTEGEWTEAGRRLVATMERDLPALVVIDPIAAAYACSEIDRGLVRRFVGAVDAAAEATGATVLLVGHPAKAGGDGYSGSTDWRNGVRGLMTLGLADTGLCRAPAGGGRPRPVQVPALARDKSSYGPPRDPLWLVSHYRPPGNGRPLELAWFATDEATAVARSDPAGAVSASAGAASPAADAIPTGAGQSEMV